MLIKAIIFDFGGVLMRTGDPAGRREWEARLGLSAGALERAVHGSQLWISAQHGHISPEEYWQRTAQALNVAEADLPALQRDYFRNDQLDTDLIALIDELRRQGYLLGLLSNDALTLETKLRDELHIYHHFDAVVISAQIGVMKPDRAAYQAIADALHVTLAESVFIDDNPAIIQGAHEAGMATIYYRSGMNVREALASILGKVL